MRAREVKEGDVICIRVNGAVKPATVTRIAGPGIVSVEPKQNGEAAPVGGRLYEYSEENIDGTWTWPKG